ncbi:MAG: HTTM domain-containing protein [Chloroflexota bacterium]
MMVTATNPHTNTPDSHPQRTWYNTLTSPVDGSSLGAFRLLFGLLMVWEVIRYFQFDRINRYYIEYRFFFTYEFVPFVTPLPSSLMYAHFVIMGLAALALAVGLFYRASAFVFLITYSYVFLLDKTQYNNHYYLIILFAFLLIIVDGNRWLALDNVLNAPSDKTEQQDGTVPYWHVFIIQIQILIVYVYAGIAKINVDWLAGDPMRAWLARRAHYPVVGPFFTTELAPYFFSYGGLIFDLSIGFLLLWRRTRLFALIPLIFFHLMNKWLFSIGIFPYMMLATTIIFADPDWLRRLLGGPRNKATDDEISTNSRRYSAGQNQLAMAFVAVYLTLQILIPLRHWLYPGDVAWTEEGHRFSWRMKLRGKSGQLAMTVTDPATNQIWAVDLQRDLADRQISKMSTRPDMIFQYVQSIKTRSQEIGIENPVIHIHAETSLNSRPYQPFIDPTINLAGVEYPLFSHASWILPSPTEESISTEAP